MACSAPSSIRSATCCSVTPRTRATSPTYSALRSSGNARLRNSSCCGASWFIKSKRCHHSIDDRDLVRHGRRDRVGGLTFLATAIDPGADLHVVDGVAGLAALCLDRPGQGHHDLVK